MKLVADESIDAQIVVRLSRLSPTAKALAVSHAIARHGSGMENAFSVIAPGIVRIRRDR